MPRTMLTVVLGARSTERLRTKGAGALLGAVRVSATRPPCNTAASGVTVTRLKLKSDWAS